MYRYLEILPGFLSWCALILPVIFSLFAPSVVAIFFILYTSLWLFRSMEFSYFLIKSYIVSEIYLKKDWYRYLTYFETTQNNIDYDIKKTNKKFLIKTKKRIEILKDRNRYKTYDKIYHIIIIATYKEDINILRATINAIKKSRYDPKKLIVVLGTEERDKKRGLENAEILKKEFKDVFKDFYSFMHPKDIPGEVKGKGGNITYSAKELTKILRSQNIDLSDYIVTTLDADNIIHELYLANLTFHYLLTPERKNCSFQPLPLFYNNIWDVPILNRMVAISSSFWHLFESSRPDRLRNFSSHAQSLEALYEMDFWSTSSIVEDGHQYWRAFFHFNGDHNVIPLFIPIYQDAVQNKSYIKCLTCQYLQLRRWAWGASDIPFVIINMYKNFSKLPKIHTILNFLRLIEGHFMWATAPIIITLATPIPRMVNKDFTQTILGNNLAYVLGTIFSFALIGIFVSLLVSLIMLPKPPKGIWYKISSILQWILVPLTTIIFGAIPALDAQTRLMLGYYLDFNVTEKIRTCNT